MAETSTPGPARWQALIRYVAVAGVLGILLVWLVPMGLRAWYARVNPCEVSRVQDASALLNGQLRRFDDVAQVAGTALPTDSVRTIYELQFTYMNTQQVEVPACMEQGKTALLAYMAAVIRGFEAYAAAEPQSVVTGHFIQSDTHYRSFRQQLGTVDACAPYCAP
jgi:hypothetical protein